MDDLMAVSHKFIQQQSNEASVSSSDEEKEEYPETEECPGTEECLGADDCPNEHYHGTEEFVNDNKCVHDEVKCQGENDCLLLPFNMPHDVCVMCSLNVYNVEILFNPLMIRPL